jgi:SHS2 domain-containing protein
MDQELAQRPDRRTHHQAAAWHAAIEHTADVGLRVMAPSPARLLEEAAAALSEAAADVATSARSTAVTIDARADDLEELVFRWLNELIALADARGEALAGAIVSRVGEDDRGYVLHARASFAGFGPDVRSRLQVKAATMHGLRVTRTGDRWMLEAYLDV